MDPTLPKVPEKVLERAYEDLLAPMAKEVGKALSDGAKAARLLLTAPIQLAAAYQGRFERMMDRIATNVPEEHRTAPPAQVVGPIVENLRYIDDTSPIWEMFESLLQSAMDRRTARTVHPAFAALVAQLSADEAIILKSLSEQPANVVDSFDYDRATRRFYSRLIESSELPLGSMTLPEQIDLYVSHLQSLNLIQWHTSNDEPILDINKKQIGSRRYNKVMLTDFGYLFVHACQPPSMPPPTATA